MVIGTKSRSKVMYTPPSSQSFAEFLAQFNVIGLAIGFIIAGNLKDIATKFIDTVLIPLIKPALDQVERVTNREIETYWGAKINFNAFVTACIKFTLLGLIIYVMIRMGMKIDHPITYVKIVKELTAI
jgi:large conductance mechanosensitive channel